MEFAVGRSLDLKVGFSFFGELALDRDMDALLRQSLGNHSA